jgi:hypothetical protein
MLYQGQNINKLCGLFFRTRGNATLQSHARLPNYTLPMILSRFITGEEKSATYRSIEEEPTITITDRAAHVSLLFSIDL